METTQQAIIPQAWIGCLSCYNSGRLRGRWVTAEQAAAEIDADAITYGGQAEQVTTEYSEGHTITRTVCSKCGGDEFDVFDQEHTITRCTVGQFYEMAQQLDEMDRATHEALTVLAGWLMMETLDELITYHEDHYCGQWDTFRDFAEQSADDVGLLGEMPETLSQYFDWERYARDLEHDYYHDTATGHTWRSA